MLKPFKLGDENFRSMITNNLHEDDLDEKKNKRRGLIIAFFIHVGVLILALIPFMEDEPIEEKSEILIEFANYTPPPPPPEPEVEEVPFEDSGSSAPDDPIGDTQDAAEQEAAPDTPEPEPQPEPTPPEPTPPTPTPPTPAPAPPTPAPDPTPPTPVQTTPEPSPVQAPPAPPKPTLPKPPKPSKPSPPKDQPSAPPRPSKPTKPSKPSTGTDANTSTNNGTKPGKPGKPTGTDNGTNAGSGGTGGTDNGTGTGEGSGHGFSRKVKDRPSQSEIKAIAQGKNGKVHVDVCINQMGKVVSANSNKAKSSLKDNLVLQKAESLAKKYRFEKDFKAPAKQCWYLVFNFSQDKGAKLIPGSYDQIIFID